MSAAGLLLLTPRLRPRSGPALRPAPLPVTATALSAICHAALAVVVVLAATAWTSRPSKTYIVNLVPATPAVGAPQGRTAPPPRAEEPPPRVTRRTPSELPERETSRTAARPPDLPARAPALPDAPARTTSLPERALPDRAPSTPPRPMPAPRAGDKELPAVASAPAPLAPAPSTPAPAPAPATRPEPPPPPLGRPSGSAQGSGALTLDVTDFPFAWYLRAVQNKITERWEGKALQGRQPVITFEIGRDGQVSSVAVKTSSGNPYYDRTAMRAITESAPFPGLPAEFPGSVLRIHLGFTFAQDRG
ncbi:MAG TPA: energy transducer TonB [Methylomirabilota bacterium]|nr:energy transducer TonB [Methylomirabilota bacterium]